ncbi:unnamed protein product, partial [Didymodactylos carnosus]
TFRALLRYRVDAGDEMLKEHLISAPQNATYISKTTQNELINCCVRTGEGLAKLILEELNELDLDPSFIVGEGYDGRNVA